MGDYRDAGYNDFLIKKDVAEQERKDWKDWQDEQRKEYEMRQRLSNTGWYEWTKVGYKRFKVSEDDDKRLMLWGGETRELSEKPFLYVKQLVIAWPAPLAPSQFYGFGKGKGPKYFSTLRRDTIKQLSEKFKKNQKQIENFFYLEESKHWVD